MKTTPAFQANIHSSKLRFSRKDFFVPIRGYGKNTEWAREIIQTADLAVSLIRRDTSAENVLKLISVNVGKANKNNTLDIVKRLCSGLLRAPRENWPFQKWADLTTSYENYKYKNYRSRLDFISSHPLHPVNAQDYSRPIIEKSGRRIILHGSSLYINKNLNKVFELSKNIFPKYVHSDIKNENLKEVNSSIAEIRWILAHTTPWLRGSDAIANVYMRAMYKAAGVKSYPLKRGVSLDLEAYCTELAEYKKNFASYFEKPPEIIE